MRVLITGASGFVGRWLTRELEAAGHHVTGTDMEVDVRDADAVAQLLTRVEPDAIAHLAAVSFAPDASADPNSAFAISIGGTINILEAARSMSLPPAVLIAGSSEVYGAPRSEDLPLTESAPLRGTKAYALSKAAQEALAVEYATRYGLPVVVTRSFNHIGAGQRPDFVVPAIAQRVAAFAAGKSENIPVGNIDVRRDLTDVADVVRAYRLLIEMSLERSTDQGPIVVNVCSGESVAIRTIAEEFCRLAGVESNLSVDPALVRASDPPEIRGDHSLLTELTGWRSEIPINTTLESIWETHVR